MTQDEAWRLVGHECPRRILAALHRSGEYRHIVSSRFPGKVLCCHKDTPLPEDGTPTPAQAQAEARDASQSTPPAAPGQCG
jgi:hypothetical protein